MFIRLFATVASVAIGFPAAAATMAIDFEEFAIGQRIDRTTNPRTPGSCSFCYTEPGGLIGTPETFLFAEGVITEQPGWGKALTLDRVTTDPYGSSHFGFFNKRLDNTRLFEPRVLSFDIQAVDGGDLVIAGRRDHIALAAGERRTITILGGGGTFGLHGGGIIDNIVYSPRIATVPEPASWAMMILGFGLAGAGLRSRAQPSARVLRRSDSPAD